MGGFLDRIKDKLSRLNVRDQATQMGLAGGVAVIVLIAAVVALPGSETAITPGGTAAGAGSITELAEKALAEGKGPLSGQGAGRSSASTGDAVDQVEGAAPEVPPITDTQIKVGIAYFSDAGATNEAAGFGAIGQVNQRRGWDAVIKDINRNPPSGRKIVPVYYETTEDELISKGIERVEQEACALYTQDNRVFMVWDAIAGTENPGTLHSCLTKAGIPEIGGAPSAAGFKKWPYLVAPSGAMMERYAAFEVDQLHAKGFFSGFKDNALPYTPQKPADGKPRIGLIRYDTQVYKDGAAAMKGRLAAHGLSLCDGCEFEIAYSADNPQAQLDDAGEVNAAIQNCKSRPGGPCTHMLFLGTRAGVRITLFFIDGAEKQQYRPRLGFNYNDAPGAVVGFLKDAAYPQMRDSMLVTWDPNDFAAKTAAFERCVKIFKDAGETFEGDQASNKYGQIPGYCDDAWYTQAVLSAVGSTLSLDTFMNGVYSVALVPSASSYGMQTKPGRRDGIGAIRLGEWFDDCNCWKPTTGITPV